MDWTVKQSKIPARCKLGKLRIRRRVSAHGTALIAKYEEEFHNTVIEWINVIRHRRMMINVN